MTTAHEQSYFAEVLLPLASVKVGYKVFISFASQVQINWNNNAVSTAGVQWLPFPELQLQQVTATVIQESPIIHIQQAVTQPLYAIQILNADGIF